jgi:uncharacterized protein (DUF488 family)
MLLGMPKLFTIGYESATIDAFLDTLARAGVKTLVDVRAVAQSRKPGFSKRGLSAALAERGIGYRHLQRLGTPAEGRNAARAGDTARMRRVYLDHLEAPDAQAEMAMLIDQARESPSALLCFERQPEECHRSILFEQLGVPDLTAEHLFVPVEGSA